ncbi:MAG: LD-carboxypeptidase [Paludibacteraceae bacterium]|nr:LD-carboxypeptidase [Paludibacteraceae bacterium]
MPTHSTENIISCPAASPDSSSSKAIVIISPSGVIDPQLIDEAASRLASWDFQVSIAPHAKDAYGRFAGSAAERLADINEALASGAPYLLCARGGYGLAQIIDQIVLPAVVPIVIGFSDITALHCLMSQHDLPSLHAVMCKHIAEYETHVDSVDSLRHLLQGNALSYGAKHGLLPHPLNRYGQATGLLRGGNLSVLYGLQATPYACRVLPGDILFIEDVGEHPYAIDRMMQNLRLSGVLSRLGGLIVGQFSDCDEDPRMPYTIYEGIRRMVEPYDYPVLFDFPAGHVQRNLAMIMNHSCTFSVSQDRVLFAQPALGR